MNEYMEMQTVAGQWIRENGTEGLRIRKRDQHRVITLKMSNA